MKRIVATLVLTVSAFFPATSFAMTAAPEKIPNVVSYSRSDNEFASAIVVDVASGEVLYEYQADKPWSAASLTKLMGALVYLDHRPSWSKVVAMSSKDEVGGGRLRVASGATLSALDLMYASITSSANNAATAMARVSGLGYAGFVKAMNAKTKSLGLTKTKFVDPSGMDPRNQTTAREIAKISSAAFDADTIRRAATTGRYRFTIRNTGEVKEIKTTNDLLVHDDYAHVFVTGGKTGFLYESMYNLAVRMKPMGVKGGERQLMVVVFGSPTREASFKTANSLANWAWKGYSWQ